MRCTAARPSIFNRRVTESKDCIVVWHGRVPYEQALDLQMSICESKKRGFDRDVLLLLEHPPTITLGRNASPAICLPGTRSSSRAASACAMSTGAETSRFTGPGSWWDIRCSRCSPGERDVHAYMRNLEESLIRAFGALYGIQSGRDPRFTGVWTATGKIAAMGVHISRWITRHGFALNVNTDLSFYDLIVPCGIVGRGVTSMSEELAQAVDLEEVADRVYRVFRICLPSQHDSNESRCIL